MAQKAVDAFHSAAELLRLVVPGNVLTGITVILTELSIFTFRMPSSLVLPGSIHLSSESLCWGGSSDVYRGHRLNIDIAIKRFRINRNEELIIKERFIKEALLMNRLRHPNLLPILGIVYEQRALCIITPYMKYGTILTFINAHPTVRKISLIKGVADGLSYMRSCGIVHGDIKSSNILINDIGQACIADFGLSTWTTAREFPSIISTWVSPLKFIRYIRGEKYFSPSPQGTYRWMAPELLDPEKFGNLNPTLTFQSDIFAFGMVIYEIYSLKIPYIEFNKNMAILEIMEGRRPKRPNAMPACIWRLVESCWMQVPQHRPNIHDICAQLEKMEISPGDSA